MGTFTNTFSRSLVQQGTNLTPLPNMWQLDADTGGYLVDDNGEVIIAVDTI